ncbi:MAG: SHOCT domain-containing protein [Xanthomonadales bacterium]|nr:SHOCT domain-containing protein [Xanthomonadales bacterium]MDH3923163.1 SHOCT domain-containing protein [Xanthomonadales bacterium]MDH3939791.1 SHOCT domain-containing protein [Xanthomonadales bacterium]MDH4000282.1 SHOCT domain-containing protein [Xanthomonadales bacterium]
MSKFGNKMVKTTLSLAITAALAFTFSVSAHADGAGAFLGGIAVAKIGQNVRERNEYEKDQAYYAQRQAEAAQRQAAQGDSAEAKLAQLDSMLRKGYITQAEYDAKKKEILATM